MVLAIGLMSLVLVSGNVEFGANEGQPNKLVDFAGTQSSWDSFLQRDELVIGICRAFDVDSSNTQNDENHRFVKIWKALGATIFPRKKKRYLIASKNCELDPSQKVVPDLMFAQTSDLSSKLMELQLRVSANRSAGWNVGGGNLETRSTQPMS